MRRFEYIGDGSSKFWEISQDGASYTVRYGRIGTEGQAKTKACADAAAAAKEVQKLIAEKTGKGYAEAGSTEKPFRLPATISHYGHCERLGGFPIAQFDPETGLRDAARRGYRVGGGEDGDPEGGEIMEQLEALLGDDAIGELPALTIGAWGPGEAPTAIVGRLIAAKDSLRSLKALFIGDIVSEESDIAYINQCDLAPLLAALPSLEELVVRGGDGLRFTSLSHLRLKALTVQSGGMSAEAVRDVVSADLPALERLMLWLGCENYGGTSTVSDLGPLLTGSRFPKLTYLGLMNCEYADTLATAVAQAPIVGRLEALDLSMGTLTDEGGEALLNGPAIRQLKYLNLRYHFLSEESEQAFKGLGIKVDVSEGNGETEPDERMCEVTE